jgi:hypothetical protein
MFSTNSNTQKRKRREGYAFEKHHNAKLSLRLSFVEDILLAERYIAHANMGV